MSKLTETFLVREGPNDSPHKRRVDGILSRLTIEVARAKEKTVAASAVNKARGEIDVALMQWMQELMR